MFIHGAIEVKVTLIDQIIYIMKELMIESLEDFQLQMFLQLLVSCVKIWHHSEIHKLRVPNSSMNAHFSGILFVPINSGKKLKKSLDPEVPLTYPEIQQYLYIFDLIDTMTLLNICSNQKICRVLSLSLMQESSKLKRLISGGDSRKSLSDLLYYNEAAIRDRIIERMSIIKMFKFKNFKAEANQVDTFTKIYKREDIEAILQPLSFWKIIEDNFDYKELKLTESLARDISVQYIGELATLWKNEFRSLVPRKEQSQDESQFKRLKRQHRVIGQRLLNFIFNLNRRTLYVFERKIDVHRAGDDQKARKPKNNQQFIGPAINNRERKSVK